jgi:hypothetical protein
MTGLANRTLRFSSAPGLSIAPDIVPRQFDGTGWLMESGRCTEHLRKDTEFYLIGIQLRTIGDVADKEYES